jgi:hypothetical protein
MWRRLYSPELHPGDTSAEKATGSESEPSDISQQPEPIEPAAEAAKASDTFFQKQRVQELLKKMQRAEFYLDRAFADNPQPLYEAKYLDVEESEIPFQRFDDLTSALIDLERLKNDLPEQYQANAEKILSRTEFVKEIISDFRSWGDGRYPRYKTREMLLYPILKLRRIDPDRFPRDLWDVTDEEFVNVDILSRPRLVYARLQRDAKLAEFDPDRFRRLFAKEYPPEVIAKERSIWEQWDQEHDQNSSEPRCKPLWGTIERALQPENRAVGQ